VLTDAEVDRRFRTLVADLNSSTTAVDVAEVSESAERPASDDLAVPEATESRPSPAPAEPADDHPPGASDPHEASDAGIVALRVLAVGVALVMCVVGVVVVQALDLGAVGVVVWFAFVVPGVTLGSLMLVDRLRS